MLWTTPQVKKLENHRPYSSIQCNLSKSLLELKIQFISIINYIPSIQVLMPGRGIRELMFLAIDSSHIKAHRHTQMWRHQCLYSKITTDCLCPSVFPSTLNTEKLHVIKHPEILCKREKKIKMCMWLILKGPKMKSKMKIQLLSDN